MFDPCKNSYVNGHYCDACIHDFSCVSNKANSTHRGVRLHRLINIIKGVTANIIRERRGDERREMKHHTGKSGEREKRMGGKLSGRSGEGRKEGSPLFARTKGRRG